MSGSRQFVADPASWGTRFWAGTWWPPPPAPAVYGVSSCWTSGAMAVQTARSGLAPAAVLEARDVIRTLARGGRIAIVTAPGGHFLHGRGHRPGFRWTVRGSAGRCGSSRSTSRCRSWSTSSTGSSPPIVSGFAGMLTLLAGEQEAGRLHIHPALIIPGGETLTPETRERLATAFDAKVRAAYACHRVRLPQRRLRARLVPRQQRLGRARAGRRRPPAGSAWSAVAHGTDEQPRQPGSADPALRPRGQRPGPARPLPMRQPAPRDPGAGPRRRPAHLPHRSRGARQHLAHGLRHAAWTSPASSCSRSSRPRPPRCAYASARRRRRRRPRVADGARRGHPPAHRAQGRRRHARTRRRSHRSRHPAASSAGSSRWPSRDCVTMPPTSGVFSQA